MTWKPLETCPEDTWVLAWCPWLPDPSIVVNKYRWVQTTCDELVDEYRNALGKRKIYQERTKRVRQWEDGGGADYWMPLPEPPEGNGS